MASATDADAEQCRGSGIGSAASEVMQLALFLQRYLVRGLTMAALKE